MTTAGKDTATEQAILDQVTAFMAQPVPVAPDVASRSTTPTFVLKDRHAPAVTAGEHGLRARLTVQGAGIPQGTAMELPYRLTVAGVPSQLTEADVAQVYPAPDSAGAFGQVLPHIALHRSTLPWEAEAQRRPWLALVVQAGRAEKATHIDVDGATLAAMPWALAAHVRSDDATHVAIIHGTQIALQGWQTAFLVDVRSWNGEATRTAHLPVLYHWSYFHTGAAVVAASPLQGLDVGFLRAQAEGAAFEKGYWPLPHFMRRGTATKSWYRGPLVPVREVRAWQPQLFHHADALLRYDAATQMLDASYAAAWELGRLLTLSQPKVARAIYRYKRATALQHKERAVAFSPFKTIEDTADLPLEVREWLHELLTLQAIPLPYLVPDPQLLPPNSLRVAYLNEGWLQSLIDGALAIGRAPEAAPAQRQTQDLALRRMAVLVRVPALGAHIGSLTVTAEGQPPLAQRVLGGDTLLCLWDAPISSVTLFAGPTMQGNYALESDDTGYFVPRKSERGAPTGDFVRVGVNAQGIVSIADLGQHSAAVGLALLGGSGEVKYGW